MSEFIKVALPLIVACFLLLSALLKRKVKSINASSGFFLDLHEAFYFYRWLRKIEREKRRYYKILWWLYLICVFVTVGLTFLLIGTEFS